MTMDDAAPEPPAGPRAYTCESIVVLEGLEPVRRRPGMYIGDTQDGSGLNNLAQVVIEQAIEQHLEDRCFRLAVTIHRGGALTVEDDGPGLPVEPVTLGRERLPALEVIMTRLHVFGMSPELSDRVNRGLHGVGPAVVSALCEQVVVEVSRGGRLHRFSARRGRADGPIAILGAAESTGTRLTMHPDPLIFQSTVFDAGRLCDMLRRFAFLHPGLRIDFVDDRPGGRRETLHGRSIAAWVTLLGEGRDGFPAVPLRLRAAREDLIVDVALRWTRERRSLVRVFANDHEVCGEEVITRGIAQGCKWAARRAEKACPLNDWDPQRLTVGLLAIANLRSPSNALVFGRGRELTNDAARILRRAVAKRLAETLLRRPTLLDELTALASL